MTHERLEQRTTELRQAIDKLLFDSQTNLDRQFRTIITERIEESQRKFLPEIEQRIRSAMKMTTDEAVHEAGKKTDEAIQKSKMDVIEQAKQLTTTSGAQVASGLEN